MAELTFIEHPLPPLYDGTSRVLVLGSFPSVKTREMGFFYGHPQNRFWKVMAEIYGEDVPATVKGRRAFALRHHIAMWDVIYSCRISGSSDASIRDVTPTDLAPILAAAPIRAVITNGKTAHRYFEKYTALKLGREDICLPSTSPANAAWHMPDLVREWSVIREYTG